MMGNTWEVSVWMQGNAEWDYVTCYRGESLLEAIEEMVKAKRAGGGCVKLEWR